MSANHGNGTWSARFEEKQQGKACRYQLVREGQLSNLQDHHNTFWETFLEVVLTRKIGIYCK